ncbi:MAG: hypothetical protein A3F90_08350 [Deltaproteobacteria bacterium RIFCSPLOWO2_12_FULL_60_19]|nr:MAG: hypothetical protein A3F90_08350 [Deltaproteobacteria bacterium RIFCSPLOWO2_12_FULL_60_19]
MRVVKLAAIICLWLAFFLLVALGHVWASVWRPSERWRIVTRVTQQFTTLLRTILGVRISLEGRRDLVDHRSAFITSNHLGYLDGMVLGSLFPVIYVSKKEVRSWPIIGQWTVLCGTVYIDRQHKDRIPRAVEQIVGRLRHKANILMFPEGTSTNGDRLLPFQTAPFAAALRARVEIVPLTISYRRIDGEAVSSANRDNLYWYGDMDFASHFWNLLSHRRIEVTIKIHPPIDTTRYNNDSAGRKQLSQACYDAISGGLEKEERNQRTPLTLS